MQTEYVIYNGEMGIFLGECLGLGFWSKLETAGQNAACTFESTEQANKLIGAWEQNPDHPQGPYKVVPVQVASPGYATIAECQQAGLPPWEESVRA